MALYSRGGTVVQPGSDASRWTRVTFNKDSTVMIERGDRTRTHYDLRDDITSGTFTLDPDEAGATVFSYVKPSPDDLVFRGAVHGEDLHIELHRATMPLLARRFRWVHPTWP